MGVFSLNTDVIECNIVSDWHPLRKVIREIMDEGYDEFLDEDFLPELLSPEVIQFILTELEGILNKLNIKSPECGLEGFENLRPVFSEFPRRLDSLSNIVFPMEPGTSVENVTTTKKATNVSEMDEMILVPCGEFLS